MIYVLFSIIAILLIILAGVAVYTLSTVRKMKDSAQQDQSFLLLQNQLNNFSQSMEQRLGDSNKLLHQHLVKGTELISTITEKLTKLDETNTKVMGFTQQLQRLEYVLRNPKQRGIYGEYLLENILGNVLPPGQYDTQYRFKDGQIVDAVVYIKDSIVPVDAKFSLVKYHEYIDCQDKSVKERIEREIWAEMKNRINETSKYVRPAEGTTEFALMFIPGEGIFYHLLESIAKRGGVSGNSQQNDLFSYAFSKQVVIVSPSTFFAYLQVIMQALQTLQVKESLDDILKHVRNMVSHFGKYDESMQKLGKHIQTLISSYNTAYHNLKMLNNDITKLIPEHNADITPAMIDKAQVDNM